MKRLLNLALLSAVLFAVPTASSATNSTLADTSVALPAWDDIVEVITLRNYNTRVVIIGITLLGLAAGSIGSFMMLRKRSLMGDAVSHATLPGIGIAFIVMVNLGESESAMAVMSRLMSESMLIDVKTGKFLPMLLLGAMLSGVLGMLCMLAIRQFTRLKEDAALGIVLSVFFGTGVSILGVINGMHKGHAAGLPHYITGKAASMIASDAQLLAGAALIVTIACIGLYKEFSVLCFDQQYAATLGLPVTMLDTLMMLLVVAVTVIGLQAVGLILIIAMLITPPAAARFWTEHLRKLLLLSALFGTLSGLIGAIVSAMIPRMPTGPIIVVVAAIIFLFSMVCGPARGLLVRYIRYRSLSRRVSRQNLLRAMYEWEERCTGEETGKGLPISMADLLTARSWTQRQLSTLLRRASRKHLIYQDSNQRYCLTRLGLSEARRIVRNHRLWELYLITHADIAPSRVDRDADQIEHVLGQVMIDKLEALMAEKHPDHHVPPSPHPIFGQ